MLFFKQDVYNNFFIQPKFSIETSSFKQPSINQVFYEKFLIKVSNLHSQASLTKRVLLRNIPTQPSMEVKDWLYISYPKSVLKTDFYKKFRY